MKEEVIQVALDNVSFMISGKFFFCFRHFLWFFSLLFVLYRRLLPTVGICKCGHVQELMLGQGALLFSFVPHGGAWAFLAPFSLLEGRMFWEGPLQCRVPS